MLKILNKYEKAYTNIKSFIQDDDNTEIWNRSYLNSLNEDIEILNELVIPTVKEHQPTLEEVKKEWEELGYVWTEGVMYIHLIRLEKDICISKMDKEYECYNADDCDYQSLTLTFQEHQLLTKTFIALGW